MMTSLVSPRHWTLRCANGPAPTSRWPPASGRLTACCYGRCGRRSLDYGFVPEEADLRAKATFAAGIGFLHLSGAVPGDQDAARGERFLELMLAMTEWLDASILDESDPSRRDPELDLYDPANPNQPPYSQEFLARYRRAQVDRNRRITKWVKEKLAELSALGRPDDEFGFVVHGTMADPRWLDPTVDPNDRTPGTCYLGDPEVVNNSPVGLARFCTLRSWLSQWSYDDANGDAVACGPDIAVPALVIGNLADDACTPSHTRRLFEAIGHPDKEMREIPGANHYYSGPDQRGTLREAVGIVTDWLHRHGFSSEKS
jgi:pimeloyl-ACP methyl ester carboxylesterase